MVNASQNKNFRQEFHFQPTSLEGNESLPSLAVVSIRNYLLIGYSSVVDTNLNLDPHRARKSKNYERTKIGIFAFSAQTNGEIQIEIIGTLQKTKTNKNVFFLTWCEKDWSNNELQSKEPVNVR